MTLGGLDAGAEHALRELAPRVLSAMMRRCRDFAAAEDAVQEALVAAAAAWPGSGVPTNPGGWLYRVACQRWSDHQDSERARVRREQEVASQTFGHVATTGMHETFEFDDEDDTLRLLFTCCHPALTAPSAIALTLRAVGGLTTAEIARSFFVPETTMAQRIARAKQTIQTSGLPFENPTGNERTRRIDAVLHVLYLIFNEGYASSSGHQVMRVELSNEAIRLSRLLHRVQPHHAEAQGLLALLLLTDARRHARTGPLGELIPLDEQDRELWDHAQIAEGSAHIAAAFRRGAVGSYQLQAAIAALHDTAPSTDATDWAQVLAFYTLLQRLSDNPMVALNRAVAVAMVQGPAAGLEQLDALDADERLTSTHRLDAVRAHLLERVGDFSAARRLYLLAAERTTSLPERNYLLTKAAKLA